MPREVRLGNLHPQFHAISKTTARVIPRNDRPKSVALQIWPCLMMNRLSAVHSATLPASFNISASSAPARFASIGPSRCSGSFRDYRRIERRRSVRRVAQVTPSARSRKLLGIEGVVVAIIMTRGRLH